MLDLMPRAAAALTRPARRTAADLLAAVLADGDTVAARAVLRLGLDVRALVTATGQAGPAPAQSGRGGMEWDRDWWVSRAQDEALRRGHGYIGTEHLLLGLLHAGPVAGALAGLGSSARAVRGQVWRTLSDDSPGGEWLADGPGRAVGDPSAPAHPVLAAIAAEEPVVGMSWAASGYGRAVRTAAYGWADPLRGVPVAADTRFRVGSVTKIATALLMLRLRDHGMVDLDEPAAAKLCSSTTGRCGWPGTAEPSPASTQRPSHARKPGKAPHSLRTPTRACLPASSARHCWQAPAGRR